ncbi:MAG: hypothetical protein Q8904_03570 [Bacteroidota bacterium]|nr:hypothetical protein [Bacteroidota bacterium]
MDVRYQSHLSHDSRPGRNYFSEFIIIFLAVTCSFFAENLREHYADRTKAKKYAQSLYDDLKTDTAAIQRTLNEKTWIKAKYDSAENILSSSDLSKNNEFIYYIDKYLSFNDTFTSQDITYRQLCTSDNSRYIENINLYKKIVGYYRLYTQYEMVDGKFASGNNDDLARIESRLFNVGDLTSLTNESINFYSLALRPAEKLRPIYRDIESLKLFYLKVDYARNRTQRARLFLISLKDSATGIMKDLTKKYNLK